VIKQEDGIATEDRKRFDDVSPENAQAKKILRRRRSKLRSRNKFASHAARAKKML
jgi:hypothetical protein